MGSVSVSSCRCCIFVSCVHPVAVLNAAFCMTCSWLRSRMQYVTIQKVWLYVFLGCTRTRVCGCDIICVGHDLNRCTG